MKSHQPPDTPFKPSREFVPSENWIEKFEKECIEALLKRARRYAARYAQGVGWEFPSASTHDPDDVVANVVRDTLSGALRWNHETEEFAQHLFDAIRSRVTCHVERAKRYRHESIDATDANGVSPIMSEVEAQLQATADEATVDTSERAAETIRCLRHLARRKPLVLRMLTAFEEGATEMTDVMEAAGMTLEEYQNARRQLARLTERLPSHLKPRGYTVAKGA